MASNVRNLSGSLLKIDWSCCLEILEAWGYKRLLVVTSECVVSGGFLEDSRLRLLLCDKERALGFPIGNALRTRVVQSTH